MVDMGTLGGKILFKQVDSLDGIQRSKGQGVDLLVLMNELCTNRERFKNIEIINTARVKTTEEEQGQYDSITRDLGNYTHIFREILDERIKKYIKGNGKGINFGL